MLFGRCAGPQIYVIRAWLAIRGGHQYRRVAVRLDQSTGALDSDSIGQGGTDYDFDGIELYMKSFA